MYKDTESRTKRAIGTSAYLLGCLLFLLLATGTPAQELVCTDCHNPNGVPPPHNSTCRDTSCLESCHDKDIAKLKHLSGPGTPVTGDRTTTCNTCHNAPFDGVYHPYRVNVSPSDPTSPGVVDLDQSCGQCHGGGTSQDAQHQPRPPALYRTKAQLAPVARGMHDFAGVVYPVTFSVVSSGLAVNVNASVNCGSPCPPLTYDWDWGDGSQDLGAGETASHTYGVNGTYTIALSVRQSGLLAGFVIRTVTVTAVDLPPDVSGTMCTWNGNTWTMTVQDNSTDTDSSPVGTVIVEWGDGSTRSVGVQGQLFTHVYLAPGSYTATLKAIDTALQPSTTFVCAPAATPAYFTISGTVRRSNGTTPVPSATVTLRKGSFAKTVYTSVSGAFSAGSLKPGTYTVTVTKSGYTFASPAATITVGPSSAGNNINALTP